MSNTTSSASPQAIPPPPPGLNYIAAIKPSLNYILIITPLAALLVPILILLIAFSTAETRKLPVFYLNILSCLLGLTFAVVNGVGETRQILEPESRETSLYLLTEIFSIIPPVFIDSVLLTRVLAFYPSTTSTSLDRLKVLALPVIVKIVRFSMCLTYVIKLHRDTSQLRNILLVAGATWYRNPLTITEWTLQVVDNSFCSIFFLYKLRLFDKVGRSGWVNRHPTVLSRIRGLFYIALGNFMFPIAFNIAQITLVVTDRSFLKGSYITLVNMYVSIIGLVFATIWTTMKKASDSMSGTTGSTWNSTIAESNTRIHHSQVVNKPLALGLRSEVNFPRLARRSSNITDADLERGSGHSFEMRPIQLDEEGKISAST